MIEFALANPLLDHEKDWYYKIDSMVYELLGFNPGWSVWINSDGIAPHIEGISDL